VSVAVGVALIGIGGVWSGCGGDSSTAIGENDSGASDGTTPNADGTVGPCSDCTDAGVTQDTSVDASSSSEGGSADGGGDGSSEGGAVGPAFCAQHSYIFCDDFDTPSASPLAAWDGGSWANTILTPDASAIVRSTAYSLSGVASGQMSVPAAFDAGQNAELQSMHLPVPPGATHLQYGFSFRADSDWTACTAGNAGWQLAAFTFGPTTGEDLILAYVATNTIAYSGGFTKFGFLQTLDPTQHQWWSLVMDIYLPGSAKTCGFDGAPTYTAPCYELSMIEADGGVIQNGGVLPPINKYDASALGEAPAFNVGLGGFANPACTVYYDNVYFDAN
jgi:hypothetical protein